jgi:hypothetical protein
MCWGWQNYSLVLNSKKNKKNPPRSFCQFLFFGYKDNIGIYYTKSRKWQNHNLAIRRKGHIFK